jgi:hypothetical protein
VLCVPLSASQPNTLKNTALQVYSVKHGLGLLTSFRQSCCLRCTSNKPCIPWYQPASEHLLMAGLHERSWDLRNGKQLPCRVVVPSQSLVIKYLKSNMFQQKTMLKKDSPNCAPCWPHALQTGIWRWNCHRWPEAAGEYYGQRPVQSCATHVQTTRPRPTTNRIIQVCAKRHDTYTKKHVQVNNVRNTFYPATITILEHTKNIIILNITKHYETI